MTFLLLFNDESHNNISTVKKNNKTYLVPLDIGEDTSSNLKNENQYQKDEELKRDGIRALHLKIIHQPNSKNNLFESRYVELNAKLNTKITY